MKSNQITIMQVLTLYRLIQKPKPKVFYLTGRLNFPLFWAGGVKNFDCPCPQKRVLFFRGCGPLVVCRASSSSSSPLHKEKEGEPPLLDFIASKLWVDTDERSFLGISDIAAVYRDYVQKRGGGGIRLGAHLSRQDSALGRQLEKTLSSAFGLSLVYRRKPRGVRELGFSGLKLKTFDVLGKADVCPWHCKPLVPLVAVGQYKGEEADTFPPSISPPSFLFVVPTPLKVLVQQKEPKGTGTASSVGSVATPYREEPQSLPFLPTLPTLPTPPTPPTLPTLPFYGQEVEGQGAGDLLPTGRDSSSCSLPFPIGKEGKGQEGGKQKKVSKRLDPKAPSQLALFAKSAFWYDKEKKAFLPIGDIAAAYQNYVSLGGGPPLVNVALGKQLSALFLNLFNRDMPYVRDTTKGERPRGFKNLRLKIFDKSGYPENCPLESEPLEGQDFKGVQAAESG